MLMFLIYHNRTMATRQPLVPSNNGEIHVLLRVATSCAHITGLIHVYDPDGLVTNVVCVGMKVPVPAESVKLSDRVLLECGTQRLWARDIELEADYRVEIPMKLLRDGEFRVQKYTWDEVKRMVLKTNAMNVDAIVPNHVRQMIYMVKGLKMAPIGGVVIVCGGIVKESDTSCLENDPAITSYKGIGLMKVVEGKPPFAVIGNIADYFFTREERVWMFEF